jgi:ABC-type polysaccharide/polyol phosphate export permease
MILQAQINMVLCILYGFFVFLFCFGVSWSLSFLKEEFHHISKMQSMYHLK